VADAYVASERAGLESRITGGIHGQPGCATPIDR